MGASIGGGNIKIVEINGVHIDFTGEYYTIFIRHKDAKGVLAYITHCLSEFNINIAFMRLYREAKGEVAYTIIEADQSINADVVEDILENPDVKDVKLIEGV